jgi:hypothetical protein
MVVTFKKSFVFMYVVLLTLVNAPVFTPEKYQESNCGL